MLLGGAAIASAALGAGAGADPRVVADVVYQGGTILTMEGDEPTYADALAVKDGKIVAVGTREEIAAVSGDTSRVIELEGRTLLPGFVDAHVRLIEADRA